MTGIPEAKVRENWRPQLTPLVSIVYMTYNQEQYVNDALQSFLLQETSFPFEILIHDDASSDSTTEIIQAYAKKYPHIIRTIYQKINQFSQPKKNVLLIAVSQAQGKYVAFCEGDDYWINPKKLQTQILEMEKYPNCNISFHPALQRCSQGKEKIIAKHNGHTKVFSAREVILGGAGFCPTASLIINKTIFQSIPSWFLEAPVGDYFLQILASLNGGALYLNEVMSVYRIGSAGSWSSRIEKDENYAQNYFLKILKSIEDISRHTNHIYQKEFNLIKQKICFYMCRHPLFSIEKRRIFFQQYKKNFNYKLRILWVLIYSNTVTFKILNSFKLLIRT